MSYFISPVEETDWKLDSSALATAIQQHWPEAEVESVSDDSSNHQLEWSIKFQDHRLEGSLDRSGQAVHLDGDIDDCAAFAVWLRSEVSDAQSLVMYDESYSVDIALEPQMDQATIVEVFTSADEE